MRRRRGRFLAVRQSSLEVRLGQPLRRAGEPRLDDDLVEVLDGYRVQADQDRRVAVEVRRGEEDPWAVGEQRLLRPEVLHARAEDRPVGRVVAERLEVRAAQRALPHEQLVLDPPLAQPARDARSLVSGSASAIRRTSSQVATASPGRGRESRAGLDVDVG